MTISLAHKAIAHLLVAIAIGDTAIKVDAQAFEQFIRLPGDEVYAILRGPIDREIVKIDIAGSTSPYLQVERGQGGTTAKAWPLGTLLFGSTHEDHYNSLIQAGVSRFIDYNPNEILSPLYAGEKIYQTDPAGCERWWKSFNGVDPYWDIITGAACAEENYRDIGWTYDLLLPALPWQMAFDIYAERQEQTRIYSSVYEPVRHDLYIGLQPAEVWKSSDGGDTWAMVHQFTSQQLSYVYCLAYNETDDTLFAGVQDNNSPNDGGIWKSTNQGATWTQVLDVYAGTPSEGAVYTIVHDPYHDTMIAGTGSNDALIYYIDDGGDNWVLKKNLGIVFPGYEDIVFCAAYEPTTHNLVVGTMPDSHIWLSEDGGDTWAKVTQLDWQYINSFAYSADEDALILIHTGPTAGAEIWKSTDGGDNWSLKQTLNQPPNNRKHASWITYNSDTDWLYFGTRQQTPWTDPYSSQIWISTDGGENFTVDQMFYNQYIYATVYDSYHKVTITGFWHDLSNTCQIWKRRNTL